jgi:Bacterial extracellular solute-binding proteins, family 3
VDGVVYGLAVAQKQIEASEGTLRIVETVSTDEQYGIAFPEDSDLVEPVNQALAEIKADGTYEKIYERWIGVPPRNYRGITVGQSRRPVGPRASSTGHPICGHHERPYEAKHPSEGCYAQGARVGIEVGRGVALLSVSLLLGMYLVTVLLARLAVRAPVS